MTPTTTAGTWRTTLGSAPTFTCSTWATNGDESDKHLRARLHASGSDRWALCSRHRRHRRDLHVRVWPARLHAREVSPHGGRWAGARAGLWKQPGGARVDCRFHVDRGRSIPGDRAGDHTSPEG